MPVVARNSPGRPGGFSGRVLVVADQEHRRVVVRRSRGVTDQVLAQGVQGALGVGLLEEVGPLTERIEVTVLVACLGHAVGVQQQLLAGGEADRERFGAAATLQAQAEGQGVGRWLREVGGAVLAYDHRGGWP